MATDIKNFCKLSKNKQMYDCEKKGEVEEQKKCSYFEKSRSGNRCMFQKYDEYCDCIDAVLKTKEKK